MNRKISLNMNQLKIIAMVFMLVDHLAFVMLEAGTGLVGDFYRIDRVMRQMGRISFPIFCFTIVEGFQKTRDVKAYLKRLLLFAVISEIPFDLAFHGSLFDFGYQNVFFTLALGLGVLMVYENPMLSLGMRVLGVYACIYIAEFLHTDYSSYGVLVIYAMYVFRKQPILSCVFGYLVLLLQSSFELTAVFGFLLILFYNGKKGQGNKYFYYIFYPGHLLLLVLLKPYLVEWLVAKYFAGMFS